MATRKKKAKKEEKNKTAEVLKDLLIAQLGMAGVPQLEIRKIVGCDIHRVSRIVKFLKQDK